MKNVFDGDNILNSDLLDERNKVYILSSGVTAKRIFLLLLQYKVKVLGFVEKDGGNSGRNYGLPNYFLTDIDEADSIYVISREDWGAFSNFADCTKVYLIDTKKYTNEFIFEENGRVMKCNAALMVTMILSRTQQKRAVLLINSLEYAFWYNLIDVLKREIRDVLIISVDAEMEKVYDLAYTDVEEIIVFVAVFEHKGITEVLNEIGLRRTRDYVCIYNSFSGHCTDKYCGFDWFLGNTFKQNKECPGFYINGDLRNAQKKIVLLGNSVTDPLFYPQKSWPEMLWEICRKQQIDVVIYNGAITDYNSTNEVIKLYRDVLLLEPDIVISYSGIIDFRQYVPDYPYINLNLMRTSKKWEEDNDKEVIFGIKDRRTAYERWINNEKIMYQICQMYGITFYGVLQPWIGSECINAVEKLQFWSEHYWQIVYPQFDDYIDNAKEFKEKIVSDIKANDWLYDFSNIFKEVDDSEIYFDSIHVNEYGNRIISENFFKLLNL